MSNISQVISARVSNETAEYVRAQGGNKSRFIEEAIRAYRDGTNELKEICFLYGIDEEKLVKNVKFLLDSGKLHVVNGRLSWNPKAQTEDFFSLDDKVEELGLSDVEKDRLKKTIAASLDRIEGSDDTGNGAGV